VHDLQGDWQPLPTVNDAFPLGFCTQPVEDLPEAELEGVALGCELAGEPPLAGATEEEAPFLPGWLGLYLPLDLRMNSCLAAVRTERETRTRARENFIVVDRSKGLPW